MIGDFEFRHNPPFVPSPWPNTLPQPLPQPSTWHPWPLEKLKEFQDLLERVKKLEDQLGCPCEPNKADYIGMLKKRIEDLEKLAGEGSRDASPRL
jgi:hypothetical protein